MSFRAPEIRLWRTVLEFRRRNLTIGFDYYIASRISFLASSLTHRIFEGCSQHLRGLFAQTPPTERLPEERQATEDMTTGSLQACSRSSRWRSLALRSVARSSSVRHGVARSSQNLLRGHVKRHCAHVSINGVNLALTQHSEASSPTASREKALDTPSCSTTETAQTKNSCQSDHQRGSRVVTQTAVC